MATGRPTALAGSIIGKLGGHVDYLLSSNGSCASRVAAAVGAAATDDSSKWKDVVPPISIPDGALGALLPLILAAHPTAMFMTVKVNTSPHYARLR